MGVVVSITYNASYEILSGNIGILLGLAISGSAGVVVYAVAISLLKVDEFTIIYNSIKRKFIR
ncbi:hypothetical protein SDC9_211919 [bioreactor metagenome]|uniref:Uncharacterized protein n=1 Tax=bioreactor metagenome TaxID=1076179 RepID=A0A645JKE5_9ZZZZ